MAALLCAHISTTNILVPVVGRWRSDKMLHYLHVQAEPTIRGFSARMLQHGSFVLLPNNEVSCFYLPPCSLFPSTTSHVPCFMFHVPCSMLATLIPPLPIHDHGSHLVFAASFLRCYRGAIAISVNSCLSPPIVKLFDMLFKCGSSRTDLVEAMRTPGERTASQASHEGGLN
jgi:hypothetical protein